MLLQSSNGVIESRTRNLLNANQVLYQLSYNPIKMPKNRQVQKVGIEPTSSPPQTVPSTADLLLDNKTSLYMMSMAEAGFEPATSRL